MTLCIWEALQIRVPAGVHSVTVPKEIGCLKIKGP